MKSSQSEPIVNKLPEINLEETGELLPSNSKKRGFIPVLKNRRFLVLWSGQIFSQLADKIYLVLMIALIATYFQPEDQSISPWVSGIMVAFTIPAVLFGSLAGVFVDRWSKKAVLVISNLLRGMLVLSVPIFLWLSQGQEQLFNLPLGFCILLIITFFVSTLTQFFAPAEQATIPLIVKRENLLPANSLYTTTMMALLILGFAIGDPLLSLADQLLFNLGLYWDCGKELLVGISYTIAGLLLLLLKTGESKDHGQIEYPHVFEDIKDGIRYLKDNHKVRNALLQLVILFSIFAALAVLAVRLAETIPGMRAEQFGFLLAAAGIGMAVGATVIGHWGQKFSHAQLSLCGSFGVAVSLMGLSFWGTNQLAIALIMIILLGGFAALVGVPMQTTIQAETPEEMRGKVFGLQNNAVNIALSLPLGLAGIAETFFGLRLVLLSLVILAMIGGILTFLMEKCRSFS
jgi:MFS family permease